MIGLAHRNDDWIVGFCDESWWSRSGGAALVEQSVAKDDPDPKAISCYGLFVPEFEKMWLRFSSMGAR